jgi:hypothetical protein
MKKIILVLMLTGAMAVHESSAQSYEVQQLILDWTKLTQMKQILSDMKTGFAILNKGYTAVKEISKGTFTLHEVFLDGLWLVSPSVRKYWKIPVIISNQLSILKEYKYAYGMFKGSGYFNSDEIVYMGRVYNNLIDQSLKNLTDLTTILTANKLRMSDDERLSAIDKNYNEMQDELMFLRSFNNSTSVLAAQRQKQQNDAGMVQQLYGLH